MNQTDRFDEIFRRGKGLLDFMDEVVERRINQRGAVRETLDDITHLITVETEHERLREAVIEAAKADRAAESVSHGSNERDIDALIKTRVAFRQSVDALIDFEREMKEN